MKKNIFIKKMPEVIIYSEKENELFEKIEALKTKDLSQIENDSNGEVTRGLYRSLKALEFQLKKEKMEKVYSEVSQFWILDENESNDEFISLHDFLEQAEYVGKTFIRTEALGTDNRYMSELENVLALYKLGNIIITVDSSAIFEKKYRIISPKYLEDNKYEFVGNYNGEYKDKDSLYNAISKQAYKDVLKKQ